MAHGFEAYALSQREDQHWQQLAVTPDRLIQEGSLLTQSSMGNRFVSTLVDGTTQGIRNRAHEMGTNPEQTAVELGIATSLGVGLGLMNKAGGKWAFAGKWIGRGMLTMMGVDVTRRVGGSLYLAGDSAINADHYQANVNAVAGHMGATVDYALMGLTGYGTAKAMSGKFSLRELVGLKRGANAAEAAAAGEATAATTAEAAARPVLAHAENAGRFEITTGANMHAGERLTPQGMRERLQFAEQGTDKKAVSGFNDLFKVMAERTNLKEKPGLAQERVQLLQDIKAVEAGQAELAGLNRTRSGLSRQRDALDGAVKSAEQHLQNLEQVAAELPGKQTALAEARAELSAAKRAARGKEPATTAEGENTGSAKPRKEPGAQGEAEKPPVTVEEAQAKFDLAKQEVDGLQSRLDSRPQLEQAIQQAKATRDANVKGLDEQIAALDPAIAAKTTEVEGLMAGVEGRFRAWTAQADGMVQTQVTAAETGSSGVRLEELPMGSTVPIKTPVTVQPQGRAKTGLAQQAEPGRGTESTSTRGSTTPPTLEPAVEPVPTAKVVEPPVKVNEPLTGGQGRGQVGDRNATGSDRHRAGGDRNKGGDRNNVASQERQITSDGTKPVTARDVAVSMDAAASALGQRRYVVGMRETAKAIGQHLELFRTDPRVDSKKFLAQVEGLLSKIEAWQAPTKWLRSDPGKNEAAAIMQRTGIDAEVMAGNRDWARTTQTFDANGRQLQGFHAKPGEMPEATLVRLQQHLEARVKVENGKNFLNKLADADRLHPVILRGLEMMRSGRLPDGTEIPEGASLIALGRRTIGGQEVVMPLGTNKPHYIDKAQYDRWFIESQTVRQKGLGALSEQQQMQLRHHHGPERFTGSNPDGFAILFPGKNGKVVKFTDLPSPIQALLGNGFAKGSNTVRVHSEYQRLNSQRGG